MSARPLPTLTELIENPGRIGQVKHEAQRGNPNALLLLDQHTNAWVEAVRDVDTDDHGGQAA